MFKELKENMTIIQLGNINKNIKHFKNNQTEILKWTSTKVKIKKKKSKNFFKGLMAGRILGWSPKTSLSPSYAYPV